MADIDIANWVSSSSIVSSRTTASAVILFSDWTPIATTNGTTTTFTDTGLKNGTTYFYNVAANNAVGVSPDTNEISVVPVGSTDTTPLPWRGSSVKRRSNRHIRIF